MIFLAGLLLKIKSAFLMVLQFCLDNWKIVLPILLLLFMAFKYNQQVKRANNAEFRAAECKKQIISMAEALQESAFAIQKSNNMIKAWQDKAKAAQETAAEAKVQAAKANAINNSKKSAIEGKINLQKPDSCELAIEEVKAMLK